MGIIGTYRPCSFAIFTEEGLKMGSPEEYVENILARCPEEHKEHQKSQTLMMVGSLLKICEDGKIHQYMPLPTGVTKEQLDEAIASGEIVLSDMEGYFICDEPRDWKEEDGVYKYDTGSERVVLGENLSPWDDLKFDGSHITMSEGFVVYEKIED